MFKKEIVIVDADIEALGRVLYAFEEVARKEGITPFIDVHPVLERDSLTYRLKPVVNRFRIFVPRRLYFKTMARVEKSEGIQLIVDGEAQI